MIAARLLSFIGKAVRDPHPLRPTKLMLTTCCNNSRKRGQPYTTSKDTIVNCLVLLFECVPEVTIDQSQGSMIDWVKEVNNKKYWYWKSLIRCLLKSTEEIPTRPTDKGWSQTLRPQPPNLHHAPCLNKDVNEDSEPHGEQDETSRLTQTHHHRQDRHLHADSKHLHHLLRQDKTESLHRNKQDIAIEIGLRLMLEKLGTTHWKYLV